MPRLDPETNLGLVSDVALKRKVRNYVAMASDNRIYMSEGSTLNLLHKEAWDAVMPPVAKAAEYKRLPKDEATARELTAWRCANFWALRSFGTVMYPVVHAGQGRGPVPLRLEMRSTSVMGRVC